MMDRMDDFNAEQFLTMSACAADIDRWLLSGALKGTVSEVRLNEIADRAEQIVKIAKAMAAHEHKRKFG
jgi:hypothetical protein